MLTGCWTVGEKTISGWEKLGTLVPGCIASHSNERQSNTLGPDCGQIALLRGQSAPVQLYVEETCCRDFCRKNKQTNKQLPVMPQKRMQALVSSKLSCRVYCADLFRLVLLVPNSVYCSSAKSPQLSIRFFFSKPSTCLISI